jgi:hypothetical protein
MIGLTSAAPPFNDVARLLGSLQQFVLSTHFDSCFVELLSAARTAIKKAIADGKFVEYVVSMNGSVSRQTRSGNISMNLG